MTTQEETDLRAGKKISVTAASAVTADAEAAAAEAESTAASPSYKYLNKGKQRKKKDPIDNDAMYVVLRECKINLWLDVLLKMSV